jgi:lipoprotein-releasing system permease protein
MGSGTSPRSGRMAIRRWPLLGFERRVAVRFLREGRMQSLLIIVGVAAGVAVVAYISALITGLQTQHAGEDAGRAGPCHAEPAGRRCGRRRRPRVGRRNLVQTQPRAQRPRSVANWPALVPVLEGHAPAWWPSRRWWPAPGWRSAARLSKSIALVGVDLDRYDRIVNLRAKVVAGTRGWAGRSHPRPRRWPTTWACASATGHDRHRHPRSVSATRVRITALVDLGVRDSTGAPSSCRCARAEPGRPARRRHQPRPERWPTCGPRGAGRRWRARWPYKVESWQHTNAQLVSALNAQSVSTG